MIRLHRTVYLSRNELRIGRLVINPLSRTGHVHLIWFRKNRTNHVASFPYRKPKAYPPPPEYITRYARLPLCDRDLSPDHAYPIAVMLDTYTAWLNGWLDNDPYPCDYRYTPTQFLDHRPADSLYGATHIDAIYETNNFTVYALTIYDGDDGGATGLTGWFEEYPVWGDDKIVGQRTELHHMTQEFDTMLSVAVQEGTLTFHGQDHPSKT